MEKASKSDDVGEACYPDYFGGMYIDENNDVVILVTDLKYKKTVMQNMASDNIVIRSCKFSYNALTEIMNQLNDKFHDNPELLKEFGINYFSLSEKKNGIEIKITPLTEEKINLFKSKVLNSSMLLFF